MNHSTERPCRFLTPRYKVIVAKRTITDYQALASTHGIEWLGKCLPRNAQKKTLWRCSQTHIFPRDFGSINFKWTGCPICKGGKPRLIDAYPDQVDQYFDPKRNPKIEIDFIMSGSNREIEWYCKEHDHDWSAQPNSIVRAWEVGRTGCSICSGKNKKTKADYHALGKERDFEWLGPQLPQTTRENTLWRCRKGHIFPRQFGNLLGSARECPICNGGLPRIVDEFTVHVAKHFDPERNPNIEIQFMMCGSQKSVFWYCADHDYEWPAPPQTIIISWEGGRTGCSICSESLKKSKDDYHALGQRRGFSWLGRTLPKDNKELTKWQCTKKHRPWPASYNDIDSGNGCPSCSGRRADFDNNLEVTFPDVAKMWHPTKNGNIKPTDVTPGSNDAVWWQCPAQSHHEFSAWVKSVVRSRNSKWKGCNFCHGQVVLREDSLGVTHSELVAEWHPTKNGDVTPFDVSYGSGTEYWWQCRFGHRAWKASPNQRTTQGGKGCRWCSNQSSKIEIRLYVELKSIFQVVEWRKRIVRKECDLLLPEYKIGIEVDGLYWHRDKDKLDRQKNALFAEHGIKTIRVREQGLPAISEYDIFNEPGADHLGIAQSLVAVIRRVALLSEEHDKAARQYMTRDSYLQDREYREIVANLPAPPDGQSFADDWPEIAETWDFEINAPLLPTMFTYGSNQKVLWRCSNETHDPYRRSIKDRVATHKKSGVSCPQCRLDKKWTPSPDELRHDYETMLMGDIVTKYGVSSGTVRNRLIEYGIARRPSGQNTL